MKRTVFFSSLALLTMQLHLLAGADAGQDFAAHEWGTFTSVQGAERRNLSVPQFALFANTPGPRHSSAMKTTVELDASNRIVLSRELRRAAGIPRRQKLIVSATPGRIVLEMESNASGRSIKRGKLKVWTGGVPTTPIEQAVNHSRHYTR
jgi:hypothetical protein